MSPHYTSILYDMGAEDLLVGVTNFCRTPPAARLKEKVGGFLDPNIEKIVQLKPDLVLMLPAHGKKAAVLRGLGLRVLVLDNNRLSDVWKTYDEVGKVLGREKPSQAAKRRLQARLETVKRSALKRRPLTALFVVGKDPGVLRNIYAAGPGTFPDELMRSAGILNVMADSRIPYPQVSKEAVFQRDPDLIFQMPPEGGDPKVLAEREESSWDRWRNLKAVKTGHVFLVPDPSYMVPGPGMVDLAEWLAKIGK